MIQRLCEARAVQTDLKLCQLLRTRQTLLSYFPELNAHPLTLLIRPANASDLFMTHSMLNHSSQWVSSTLAA